MIERRSSTPDNVNRRQKFDGLEKGLRNKEDPVTWRTLIVDLRCILGSDDPDNLPPPLENIQPAKEIIKRLTRGTYVDELQSEILWGCFGKYGEDIVLPKKEEIKPLDYLLINSRLKSQEILWKTADALKAQGKSVAVINIIGHFNDGEPRNIGPRLLVRPVKDTVFLSSTQNMDGGDVSVLNLALRALRNPNFAYMTDNVHVIIPMFGGSRGHKPGQAEEIGFEALETIYSAKDIIGTVEDIKQSIDGPHKYDIYPHVHHMRQVLTFPNVDYSTVDIHNEELPAKKFIEKDLKFESLSPAPELASECMHVVSETAFSELPKRIIACDGGSKDRTEKLALEILKQGKRAVEIVYIDKTRIKAGEVANSKIANLVIWKLKRNGEIVKKELKQEDVKFRRKCILIFNDDMIDTGGTAGSDIKLVKSIFPNSQYTIFIATHPVFSQGVGEALSKMAGIDTFIVGDTLGNSRFVNYKNIKYVNLGTTIARSLLH